MDNALTTFLGVAFAVAMVVLFAILIHVDLQNGCHVVNQSLSSYYGACE